MGTAVAVKREDHLERGKILAIGTVEYLVYFVDKGDSAFVALSNVFKLPDDLCQIPPIVYNCCIDGVGTMNLFSKEVDQFCKCFPVGRVVLVCSKGGVGYKSNINVDFVNECGEPLYKYAK